MFDQLEQLKETLLSKIQDPKLETVKACKIEINNRMRSVAGKANYKFNKVILNGRLLGDNPEHIEQTFAHELAHLISVALYGIKEGRGHGQAWRTTMIRLGYNPDRCHKLDVSKYRRRHKVKGYARCSCKTHELKAKMFNKILNDISKFKCLICNTHLELTGIAPKHELYSKHGG
jgi:SprT protein